jgi:anti-anti-sigma factor
MSTITVEIFRPDDTLLSAHNAHKLLDWINDALSTGHKDLLIDLGGTDFMDSSGLGALVTALKRAKTAGANLALCSLKGQAKLLFELTNMFSVFDIYANPEEFSKKYQTNH